jgi:hypothetical protein
VGSEGVGSKGIEGVGCKGSEWVAMIGSEGSEEAWVARG